MKVDFGLWVKNRLASLVSYANAGTDIVATNVQTAITELANRHFGKNAASAASEPDSTTGSGAYVTKVQLSLTNIPAGTYRIGWTYEHNSSQNNTVSKARVVYDSTNEISSSETSNVLVRRGGFFYVTLTAGNHTVSIQHKVDAGNGNSIIRRARLEFWRRS